VNALQRGLAALLLIAALSRGVHAQEAAGDSLMKAYLGTLADSTDAWFGASAAPLDTAGLDSALAVGLARGPGARARVRTRPQFSPALGYQRADGAQLGAAVSLNGPWGLRLRGQMQGTTGNHDLLGTGQVRRTWRGGSWRSRVVWTLRAGRMSEAFDREHRDDVLHVLHALWGDDRQDYLRRDGVETSLEWSGANHRASLAWRDQLESGLVTTTRWTLTGGGPAVVENRAPRTGRMRELGVTLGGTLPFTRLRLESGAWTSDPALGSDADYRRMRVVVGGDVSLGRHLGFVPQVSYGRLWGEPVPQAAFFLGGTHSLRTIERNAVVGTGQVFARGELVLADDLRRLLHLPLPSWLPLQASAFAASGAAWGHDAIGVTPERTRRDGPDATDWRSEAGAGLSWRPGVPRPDTYLRFEVAWPIGHDARQVSYTLGLQGLQDLLPARR
jgi:hypothetical protein